jgi:hypothetical protein
MRLTSRPRVDLAALLALRTLLASAAKGDPGSQPSSHAPSSDAARESCDPKRRDAHATPAQPFCGPVCGLAGASPPIRSVRPTPRRRGSAVVADAPRGDASDCGEPPGTAHPRARVPGSRLGQHGNGR